MTFSQYGIVNFKVQFWDGTAWDAVTGGVVTGNNKVWRKFNFSDIATGSSRAARELGYRGITLAII